MTPETIAPVNYAPGLNAGHHRPGGTGGKKEKKMDWSKEEERKRMAAAPSAKNLAQRREAIRYLTATTAERRAAARYRNAATAERREKLENLDGIEAIKKGLRSLPFMTDGVPLALQTLLDAPGQCVSCVVAEDKSATVETISSTEERDCDLPWSVYGEDGFYAGQCARRIGYIAEANVGLGVHRCDIVVQLDNNSKIADISLYPDWLPSEECWGDLMGKRAAYAGEILSQQQYAARRARVEAAFVAASIAG